jgi:hypothetical protein
MAVQADSGHSVGLPKLPQLGDDRLYKAIVACQLRTSAWCKRLAVFAASLFRRPSNERIRLERRAFSGNRDPFLSEQ